MTRIEKLNDFIQRKADEQAAVLISIIVDYNDEVQIHADGQPIAIIETLASAMLGMREAYGISVEDLQAILENLIISKSIEIREETEHE